MKKLLLSLLTFFSFVVFVSAQTNGVGKIDEFNNLPCDEYLSRFDAALQKAYENPASTVYILIYEGKESKFDSKKKKFKLVLPRFGSAKAKIVSMRNYLLVRNFSADRFSFIETGLREELTVEFWLVPSGATPPKLSPTLKKIKYQKGKAHGFCIGCCDDMVL